MASADTSLPPLRFETNIPEVIALAFEDGLAVSGKYGDQVMFSLADGRKMYVAPAVAETIRQSGIRPHEPFEICKREVKEGNRRYIRYTVEPLPDHNSGAGVTAPTPSIPISSGTASNSSQHTNVREMPKPAAAPVADPPPPPAAAPAAPSIRAAYREAIDVLLDACLYAKERGMLLTPQCEDVRALAATIHISASRNGGRA